MTTEIRRQQMKCLVIGALIVTLVGCSSHKSHPEEEQSYPRQVTATVQRIVPLSASESEQLATLKAAGDAARAADEKAAKALSDYRDVLLGKYAGKKESLEISDDSKYVIARPAREYYGYAIATTSGMTSSAACPTKKKKSKAQ